MQRNEIPETLCHPKICIAIRNPFLLSFVERFVYSISELFCLLKYVKAYVCANELHDSLVCEFGH